MATQRKLAPGPNSKALKQILAEMRGIAAEVRKIERQLALATSIEQQVPLVRKLHRLFGQREAAMNKWIEQVLPRIGADGVMFASKAIGAPYAISRLMERTLREIQNQTFSEVAASTTYLTDDVKRMIRQMSKELTDLQVDRGLSIDEARRILQARMQGIGLRAFQDRSGRRWRLDTYSEMLCRTRTAHAYSTGTIVRSAELGVDAFEVFDGTQDEICAEADGTIVDASWAMNNTIGHPNCTRAFGPVPGYDGEVQVPGGL